MLTGACHAVNLAREQDLPLKPGLIALLEAFHEAQPALTKTRPRGRPPRRVGHNLLLRLSTYKQDVLRFLTDPQVPFTNNLAERDGRMMKLRQKISGGFRASSLQFGNGMDHQPVPPPPGVVWNAGMWSTP